MKKLLTLVVAVCFSASCFSQGLWSQKATPPFANNGTTSFSIQSLAYVYTGRATNNFFAYDPVANTWTALADFPGQARSSAAGFATDSFGYIGAGGTNTTAVSDFYKYYPSTNTWASVASYPDSVTNAFSFAINNIGYVVNGNSNTGTHSYAYDEASNVWSPIASLPFAMNGGFSAVANAKGYCGFGGLDSIYEYTPGTNTWISKATVPFGLLGNSNTNSLLYSFVINNKIYVSDVHAIGTHAGMHVFDPAANTWSEINVFPYPSGQCDAMSPFVGFGVGNKGYLGGNNGCLGTTFWQYDTAYNFVITSISPDTVCPNSTVSVTVSSNLSFSGSNYLKLKVSLDAATFGVGSFSDSIPASGAGTYSFTLPPNMNLTANINSATVSVFSSGPAQQTDYFATKFYIKKGPTEIFLPPSFKSCGGSALLLYRSNSVSQISVWSSSPAGVNDTSYVLSFTPTQNTTLYVNDIYTPTGCSVLDSSIVYFSTHPLSNISDSSYGICTGTSATLGGTAATDCSYTWTGPGGFSSTSVDPVVTPSVSGVYHVLVKDTLTYCSVGVNIDVTVKQPPAQTICYVTVDSASTHNIVIWEKLDKYATDSFIIYREASTNNYVQIGAVQRDSLSEYHDYGSNPNVTAYRYKIAAMDTCGGYGTLSPYHNTIHLQYLGTGNLIWNVYEIENDTATPVSSFDVYWDTLANGNWAVMLNVPGNQYTATDVNFGMHPNAKYRIVANWAYSCTPARGSNNEVLSNIIQLTPTGVNNIGPGQSVSLYPNPAANELMIIAGSSMVQQVSILSAEGKLISTYSNPVNNRLDVSQLASGIYIAEIKINDMISRIKWVKM